MARLKSALAEIVEAGWVGDVEVRILEGPSEYLYGEETALLEVIDGRPPFPRIAPPFRRGIVEVVESEGDADSGSGLAANVQMAGTEDDSPAPPVLVNNVETMANVPAIIAKGAKWFRTARHDRVAGNDRLHHHRRRRASRRVREYRWAHRCAIAIDTAAGGVLARRQRGLRAGRRLERRADR